MDERMRREINEAIDAGNRALDSLYAAQQNLNSAGNWGIVDMFGGGFFTDLMKHSKLDNAVRYMEQAKQDLYAFEKELRDVSISQSLNLEVGDFLTFADFFFDGIVADYLVQSRISETKAKVAEAINRVQYIIGDMQMSLR